MNLPHLPPILFANEVLEKEEGRAVVACSFPSQPDLPMFIEAAAQATSAFSTTQKPQKGFLVLVKECRLLQRAHGLSYAITLSLSASLGNSSEFSFEARSEAEELVAQGFVMVVVEG